VTNADLQQLHAAVEEVLIDEVALQSRIAELGVSITEDYAGRDLLLVGVLKGAIFFMADLMRHIEIPCEVDFMAISSYGAGVDSSGVVRILKDLDMSVEGRNVLVVEDIIDSGLTLSYLLRNLEAREPASLEICALLTKPERRENDVVCSPRRPRKPPEGSGSGRGARSGSDLPRGAVPAHRHRPPGLPRLADAVGRFGRGRRGQDRVQRSEGARQGTAADSS
jgi:hypoxanthine phosphoribosyltransferase